MTHVTPDEHARDSPTGSVGEHDVALLARPLDERHARVSLPVPHGLPEYGSLAACEGGAVSLHVVAARSRSRRSRSRRSKSRRSK